MGYLIFCFFLVWGFVIFVYILKIFWYSVVVLWREGIVFFENGLFVKLYVFVIFSIIREVSGRVVEEDLDYLVNVEVWIVGFFDFYIYCSIFLSVVRWGGDFLDDFKDEYFYFNSYLF